MKIIKYFLLLLPFLIFTDVKAVNLGTPLTAVDYVDNTNQSGNATISSWWNNDYYEAPYRLGYFTSITPEAYKMAFLWNNSSLCNNQNLQITGYIGGLWNFFSENSYTFSALNNNQNMTCSITQEDNSRLKYTCVGVGGGSLYISLQQNSFTSHNNYQIGVSRNQDVTCDVTNLDIMQQNILNTQNIINNQTNNTNSIINNQNSNTQDIINNQNQNTQQQIESQQVCNVYDKSSIILNNSRLNNSGHTTSFDGYGVTDFIHITGSTIEILDTYSSATSSYSCFYNVNKEFVSCISLANLPIGNLTIPTNAYYFRTSIRVSSNHPQFKVCTNGNQALTDSITSEDSPNTNQDIDEMNDMIASDTPISDLLTLPLTLIDAYYIGITSSCSPYNFGSLLGTSIIFPCIDLEQRLGTNLWLIIDSLCSIFLIYSIAMLFVHAFDNLTSLKDDFDDMYVPRHAGKHVGSGVNG